MASSVAFLEKYRQLEADVDPTKQTWYLTAAVAFSACNAFPCQPELYKMAVKDLPLDQEKLVQRRIKEAILKSSILTGVPRCLQSLIPIFREFKEDGIDTFAPRTEELNDAKAKERREKRAEDLFIQLFTAEGAKGNRELLQKNHPDAYLMLNKWGYEYWWGEDRILTLPETEVVMATAITCTNAPRAAVAHTRGIVKVGGSKDLARRTQNLAIEVARKFNTATGDLELVENIDWEEGLNLKKW